MRRRRNTTREGARVQLRAALAKNVNKTVTAFRLDDATAAGLRHYLTKKDRLRYSGGPNGDRHSFR